MFVRHIVSIAAIALLGLGSHARADKPEVEASFVVSVRQPLGGNASRHAQVKTAVEGQQAALKTAVLAKTKDHPASRLSMTVIVQVQATGAFKTKSVGIDNWRDAKGSISDPSIKTVVSDTLAKTPKVSRDAAGTNVELSIKVLQP